jgi:hypothetical protein
MYFSKIRVTALLIMVFANASLAVAGTVLTFADNTSPSTSFPISPYNISHPGGFHHSTAMGVGAEFRMIDPSGNEGGGLPQLPGRDVYFGGEQWMFDNTGFMNGVAGTPGNNGATVTGEAPGFGVSSAPVSGSNPTISQKTFAAGAAFDFLAPTTTSLAGVTYGAAAIDLNLVSSELLVRFPVLELQWGNSWSPLGAADNDSSGSGDGVTFFGSIFNVASCGSGCTSFDYRLFAEETWDDIAAGLPGAGDAPDEDPLSIGFGGGGGWTFQWEVVGSGVQIVPIPAGIWLFGSGLLALAGISRRKKAA